MLPSLQFHIGATRLKISFGELGFWRNFTPVFVVRTVTEQTILAAECLSRTSELKEVAAGLNNFSRIDEERM